MTALLQNNLIWLIGLASLLWLVSIWRRDASIADPAWGTGFVIVAWITWWQTTDHTTRSTLLVVMTTLWGLRLSLFLLIRNRSHGEDRRYREMRNYHGPGFWWRSWFTVFALQALLLWWIAFPIQFGIGSPGPALTAIDWVAIGLWAFGLLWETAADWQLARFQSDPANQGQVLDRGLWRFSRHPNYFGDFCVWWGIFAVAALGGAWFTVLSPIAMSWLLMYVSGVRLTESTIGTRRPRYAEYQRRTNAFFPGPPRSGTGTLN